MPEGSESQRQPAGRPSSGAGMEPVTEELLDRMVRPIVNAVDPEKVILFGAQSRRGGATVVLAFCPHAMSSVSNSAVNQPCARVRWLYS